MARLNTADDLTARAVSQKDGRYYFNATAVAHGGRAVLILGASGRGKSMLALALMAHGTSLVSDDGVWLAPSAEGPVLLRPDDAPPLIEARQVGLLQAGPITAQASLALVVDLDRAEEARLPPNRRLRVGAHDIPLVLGANTPGLAAAVLQMVRFGRHDV
ncbi:HPr kinase [Roseibacterium elongatum DSM 19469]|uniref:HPr kinase n=1 Tax=Roseicyclus elongatus DSM 19469 TaxID=1294273 RepID=W8S507_9RHOB|nr:serine kinase [Roseibacterium elongatum]AHM03896.1 HPr kinase [Roseibacterium elongatum DSM 19469]